MSKIDEIVAEAERQLGDFTVKWMALLTKMVDALQADARELGRREGIEESAAACRDIIADAEHPHYALGAAECKIAIRRLIEKEGR